MLILTQQIKSYTNTNLDQPYLEWDASTSYDINISVVHKNHIYRNIVHDNVGVDPSLNTGKWLLFGVDNPYAAIDLHSGTATVMDDGLTEIELTFNAENFNHLVFGRIMGDTLTVEERDIHGTLLDTRHHDVIAPRVNAIDWYTYYYAGLPNVANPITPVDLFVSFINPRTHTITVHLTHNTLNVASIGSMVGGNALDIGKTEYGVNVSLIDYSKKETDEYGITTLTRRKSREFMTLDVVTPAKQIQYAKRVVKNALGTALMFIADPDKDSKFENLIMLGYIDEWTTYLNNGIIARTTIRMEEIL